jgi:hypothetical protein
MNNAPPVVYPAGRSLLEPLAWGLFLPLSLWLWQPWGGLEHLRGGALWGGFFVQGLLLWALWSSRGCGGGAAKALHWDGTLWHLEWGDGRQMPVQLSVHLDTGRMLWLSVRPVFNARAGLECRVGTLWLLQRVQANSVRWHGFRCAVYCRSIAQSGPHR